MSDASCEDLEGDESTWSVAEEETESSTPSDWVEDGVGEVSRIVERVSALSRCFDMIFCVIRVCENNVFCGREAVEYSSTVDLTACVISSLEV